MNLRERIDRLLALPDSLLCGPEADELEDVIQLGFSAVYSGELWVSQVSRALDEAAGGDDADRLKALSQELRAARGSVERVRTPVVQLAARAQELGVGAPGSTSAAR